MWTFKGLRALGGPVKGRRRRTTILCAGSPPKSLTYAVCGHSCAQYSIAEPKKTQVLKIAAAANPPLQRVHLRSQYLQVEAHF